MYLLLLNKLQEQQHLQKTEIQIPQIYSLKTYGYKLWETEKRKTKKKIKKQLKTYVTIRTY